jgi:hypothetical protein
MNRIVPAHSRVVKKLVLIEDPQKPFQLTDKGTVRAQVTLNMYEEQIEKAYKDTEADLQDGIDIPTEFGEEEIKAFVNSAVRSLLPDEHLACDDDLFEYGKDMPNIVCFFSLNSPEQEWTRFSQFAFGPLWCNCCKRHYLLRALQCLRTSSMTVPLSTTSSNSYSPPCHPRSLSKPQMTM